jgi:hypothetical protein
MASAIRAYFEVDARRIALTDARLKRNTTAAIKELDAQLTHRADRFPDLVLEVGKGLGFG